MLRDDQSGVRPQLDVESRSPEDQGTIEIQVRGGRLHAYHELGHLKKTSWKHQSGQALTRSTLFSLSRCGLRPAGFYLSKSVARVFRWRPFAAFTANINHNIHPVSQVEAPRVVYAGLPFFRSAASRLKHGLQAEVQGN